MILAHQIDKTFYKTNSRFKRVWHKIKQLNLSLRYLQ